MQSKADNINDETTDQESHNGVFIMSLASIAFYDSYLALDILNVDFDAITLICIAVAALLLATICNSNLSIRQGCWTMNLLVCGLLIETATQNIMSQSYETAVFTIACILLFIGLGALAEYLVYKQEDDDASPDATEHSCM